MGIKLYQRADGRAFPEEPRGRQGEVGLARILTLRGKHHTLAAQRWLRESARRWQSSCFA